MVFATLQPGGTEFDVQLLDRSELAEAVAAVRPVRGCCTAPSRRQGSTSKFTPPDAGRCRATATGVGISDVSISAGGRGSEIPGNLQRLPSSPSPGDFDRLVENVREELEDNLDATTPAMHAR